jgi:outer membrane protein assembly factor BamB
VPLWLVVDARREVEEGWHAWGPTVPRVPDGSGGDSVGPTPVRRPLIALSVLAMSIAIAGCSVYGSLRQQWSFQTGGKVAATPVVQWSSVFVGSWDGYEYALEESTGAQRWRKYLGVVSNPSHCEVVGVTSAPLAIAGTLYLGGGDNYWYALNQFTGDALWRVFTGDTATGHYNWSSPAALNGFAYVGISSHCDSPLVQGQLLRVDIANQRIANTWDVVPDGQLGGTIWTKPVVDPSRNAVFVTTGNRAYDSTGWTQAHAEAVVSVDATTLAVNGYWSLPPAEPTPDADWGTAPLLFRDSLGRDLVAAGNKNGIVYAFLRDNLAAGPVWSRRIAFAATNDAPAAGGIYSNGLFDGQRVYYAGGGTTIGGKTEQGSVRALDPRTGAVIWERALPSKVYGALAGANGMLIVPAHQSLYLVDPADGRILYENALPLYGAATVANGRLFIGDRNGVVHAYTYPSAPGEGTARIALRQGCQAASQPAPAGIRLRVTRAGKASAPASISVYDGAACGGAPIARASLRGGESAVLTVSLPAGSDMSVLSSKAVRLELRQTQR